MQKGKTWQRVASAVLAVMMTMSTFSSTIAYAAEPITTDSSLVTDAVSESTSTETVEALDSASSSSSEEEITEPVGTPVPTEMPDETDSSEPEATPEPTEVPTSTPEPTETPDATATPEPTEVPEATETPDVVESDFVAVSLADDATEGQVEAEIGDEVTFNAHVNRNDVNLHYQWYKRFIEPHDTDYDMDVMEYDYSDAEPTTYGYLNEDKTPAETLADNPDATWSGIELYRAVADAMAAIGADASNINIEFNTRNYALEGFEITAANVDGNIVISADKDNEHGKPTGATRKYQSFALTDGNKLEINSEWYGKTVYFRYHNSNIVGNTATGAAVSIPASGRGTSYKDAVQVLFCYTKEEDGTTFPLTIKEYVNQATTNGYSQNGMAHITLNTVSCNDFNVDPDRYLKDAEGNYRVDSVYWGTCYFSEPDLSGKAYYALKNYIGNGYGFGIGHDTMYAYAGAWFDAHGGGRGYPNNVYDEKKIDPNDTATRYYQVNSWEVSGGHWNMNALMGENNSNTLVGSGYYSASDEAYFGWIVDPLTVPSAIMSSGWFAWTVLEDDNLR